MQIYFAHSSEFDFKSKLYEPLRSSSLNAEHEFLLPHEGPVEEITRDMIRGADAFVAEVSRPSLGTGIEMGWADAFGVPVIAMSEKGARVSFSINNVTTHRFEYEDADDMLKKLRDALESI